MKMTIEEIRREFGKEFLEYKDNLSYAIKPIVERMATRHFGAIPYKRGFVEELYSVDNVKSDGDICECSVGGDYDTDSEEEEFRENSDKIDYETTLSNVIKEYPDTVVLNIYKGKLSKSVLFNDEFIYYDGTFHINTPNIPERIMKCVEEKGQKPKIRWILRSTRGYIDNKFMEICPKGGIEGNYNDDFYPIDEKVRETIHNDESSIIILHGKPGTGKTSYIRNLISENRDIMFYWVDSSMFNYIDSSEFVDFVTTCKNAVFVLEDSESLLTSRDEEHNPAMQTLLSISDGMLGDSLKLKFICTFNTDLKNIDKAILRKGRMKVKYEFKELETDKVKGIFRKIGIDEKLAKPMTISDAYNYAEDNGNESTSVKKVGFN